jgi:hypothetical protein
MKKETIYFLAFLLVMLILIFYVAKWIKKDIDIIKVSKAPYTV